MTVPDFSEPQMHDDREDDSNHSAGRADLPQRVDARIPRIRRAVPDEAADLCALAVRSREQSAIIHNIAITPRPELTTVSTELIFAGQVFVIECDDRLIGFCSLAFGPGSAELCQCFVDPDFFSQSFGRLLWSYSLRELRRHYPRVKRLFVISDRSSRGFFERCGARRIGYASGLLPRMVYEIQEPRV